MTSPIGRRNIFWATSDRASSVFPWRHKCSGSVDVIVKSSCIVCSNAQLFRKFPSVLIRLSPHPTPPSRFPDLYTPHTCCLSGRPFRPSSSCRLGDILPEPIFAPLIIQFHFTITPRSLVTLSKGESAKYPHQLYTCHSLSSQDRHVPSTFLVVQSHSSRYSSIMSNKYV